MKVSPECFIQLCQRVNILHKGKRKGISEPMWKVTGKHIIESQEKGEETL